MSFGQPFWFWALALLPVLFVIYWRNERQRGVLLQKLVAARLLDRLAGTVSLPRRRARFALVLLGLALVIISLAQPRYGVSWQESKRRGRDVLIAIDTSKSMLATDLAPNRLARAKLAAQDLITALGGDRVGLIAFAGGAFLQAPLTADYGAVLASLQELDTEIIPRGGTDIAAAIRLAVEAFGKGESDRRALVIFTDGEELDADSAREAEANKDGLRVFTVGLGSTDGSLIPVPGTRGGTEFVKDADGQIVKSRLDEERLRKIAEVTGGFYLHFLNGREQMTQLVRDGLGKMSEADFDAKTSRTPIERYQWPLGAGIACLAGALLLNERRRGATARLARGAAAAVKMALFGTLALGGFEAQAVNSGVEAYQRKEYRAALEKFAQDSQKDPNSLPLQFNLGRAAYEAGEYDKALEAFSKAVTSADPQLRSRSEFNLGNTLFRRAVGAKDKEPKVQELTNAIQHYDQALKMEPKNAAAQANRDLASKLIAELQKPPPPEQEQQKNEEKKKDDKKDQEKKDQGEQDKKDSSSPQNKDPNGEKQDGQEQSGEDQKSDKSDASKDPQKEEQKGANDKPGDQKEDSQKEKEGESGEAKGSPEPAKPEPKKEGAVKDAPQFDKSGEENPASEEAAEAAAASAGEMTEQQAKNLLESLKGEDARVDLLGRGERKRNERVLRDW